MENRARVMEIGSRQGPESDKKSYLVARTGMLVSLALVLQILEGMLPLLGIPGAKLGLANVITLLTLYLWGWKQAVVLALLRQAMGGLLTGKLLSTGFLFGLAGGLASIAVMQIIRQLAADRISLTGTSVAGAISHNWAQWLVALWLMGHAAVAWYLPILTLVAVPCGLLVAITARSLCQAFRWPVERRLVQSREICLIVGVVFLTIFIPTGWAGGQINSGTAVIIVDGQVVERLDLQSPGTKEIVAEGYHWTLRVERGGIRVEKANCPDRTCVHTGLIQHQGQRIVCAPGRMVIRLDQKETERLDGLLP